MNKSIKYTLLIAICLCTIFIGKTIFADQIVGVQTNSPTNISNFQAVLNGYISGVNPANNYAYFQWGTTTAYGNITSQQNFTYSGPISQTITGLTPNTIYHFRLVAVVNGISVFGQDMTFNSSGNTSYYTNGTMTVSKQVINISSRNLNWQSSVNANSGDVLSFAITLQAGNADIHNVVVRDILPAGLVYRGNLMVNALLNTTDNISNGINVGTIPANGICIVSYQVQVVNYGTSLTNTLINNATVTSTEAGTQTASATVIATNSAVLGATYVETGLTNNIVQDSFLLPLFLITLMSWLYFTGRVYTFADWLGIKV